MRLKNRVSVVTGAASGIGQGIATLFAESGAKIVAADKNILGLSETVDQIIKQGHQSVSIEMDVTKPR